MEVGGPPPDYSLLSILDGSLAFINLRIQCPNWPGAYDQVPNVVGRALVTY